MKQTTLNKTKKTALMGILFALGLALSFFEGAIPALPFLPPGVKPGISNIIVMFAASCFGIIPAIVLAVLKSLFVLITRGFFSFLLSFSGGFASALIMGILIKYSTNKIGIIGVSVIGAITHSSAQLVVFSCLMASPVPFAWLPLIILSTIAMGILTGSIFWLVFPFIKSFNPDSLGHNL